MRLMITLEAVQKLEHKAGVEPKTISFDPELTEADIRRYYEWLRVQASDIKVEDETP